MTILLGTLLGLWRLLALGVAGVVRWVRGGGV